MIFNTPNLKHPGSEPYNRIFVLPPYSLLRRTCVRVLSRLSSFLHEILLLSVLLIVPRVIHIIVVVVICPRYKSTTLWTAEEKFYLNSLKNLLK